MNPIFTVPTVRFGCDPEFFFQDGKGSIVGAEKVLDTSGKLVYTSPFASNSAFVLDGVQVELNPAAQTCRAYMGNEIKAAMIALKAHLAGKEVSACFNSVIEIDKEELASLSEASRRFGCAPSNNAYNVNAKIHANPAKYMKRAAGGHLHFGISTKSYVEGSIQRTQYEQLWEARERVIPLLDIIVGNTCVMIDRHPLAAERRKNYGRAGEYRLPSHGIEYRTLSNFWLRSYKLMSFVMGLSRIAWGTLFSSLISRPATYGKGASIAREKDFVTPDEELLSLVNMKKIVRAINKNDLDLARENFEIIKPFITKWAGGLWAGAERLASVPLLFDISHRVGLGNQESLRNFDFFLKKVWEGEKSIGEGRGIEFWFPQDPLESWSTQPEGHDNGWESYLSGTVRAARLKEEKALVESFIGTGVSATSHKYVVSAGQQKPEALHSSL